MTKNQSTGDKFKTWCSKMGRPDPPDTLVDAMNNSLDAGDREVKRIVVESPEVYRAYRSFLTRIR